MALLSFMCPTKGYPVSTGIDLPAGKRITSGQFYAYSQCPYCGIVHEWTLQDVQLGNRPDKQLSGPIAAAAA
jgi:hypothetical protein